MLQSDEDYYFYKIKLDFECISLGDRLAASPLVTLEGHQKGVMALSWCKQDPDLLLSAGKDGRVLCWNPNNTRPVIIIQLSLKLFWVQIMVTSEIRNSANLLLS